LEIQSKSKKETPVEKPSLHLRETTIYIAWICLIVSVSALPYFRHRSTWALNELVSSIEVTPVLRRLS
jgi:hypothetical protein